MADRIILTIGTKKGVFVADAAKARRSFALRGPFGPGVPVYSTLIDTRLTLRLYASSCNPFFGMKVLCSTDMGKSFTETKSAPSFPKDDGRALVNIWAIEAGGGKKELWCGVEPASLFRSHDGGDSWDLVPGISNHDHARKWQPGNGGLCMHTIIRDGSRVHLGISTGGTISVRTVAKHSGRPIKASAPASPQIPIPSSVNASTKSFGTTPRQGGCICKTTADGQTGPGLEDRGRISACCEATTTAIRGDPSPKDCRQTSDFPSWFIRTTPTRYM